MRPDEYELLVAEYYRDRGYSTEVSQYTGDYGVDVFATKGQSKIAIQVKMYGNTARKINRQMIMELHGAKDYFDCTKAIIATDGEVIGNAQEVAQKLDIGIVHIPATRTPSTSGGIGDAGRFELIWEHHVMPLEGATIRRSDGKSNKIVKVDWSGIERITSTGRRQRIKIEIFKQTVNHLLRHGEISRKHINDEYKDRASSGIVLILAHTSIFELTKGPVGLKMKRGRDGGRKVDKYI